MKRKLQFMPKAIHDRRSIHGEANSFLPSLSRPHRGQFCVFTFSKPKARILQSTHKTVPGATQNCEGWVRQKNTRRFKDYGSQRYWKKEWIEL